MLAIAVAAVVVVILIALVPAIATVLGVIVLLGSIIVLGWGTVGIVVPQKVGLPDRGSAVGAWIVSVVMFIIGAVILPDRPDDPPPAAAELEQGPVELSDPPREERRPEPPPRTGNVQRVSRETWADGEWPLTINSGSLTCLSIESTSPGIPVVEATFLVDDGGRAWALNGTATSRAESLEAEPDIRSIWKDNPDLPGTKFSIGGLIDLGLELCDGSETSPVMPERPPSSDEVLAEMPPEPTVEQKLAALDRLNAASDLADAVMSEINRKCAPPGSRYAETVAYAKCLARFLVTLCPDVGEGPLIDMSNAARDMDAPVAASLLNQASLDCWTAVYYADTPRGGTLPRFVGEAVTQMGEKMAEASARLR